MKTAAACSCIAIIVMTLGVWEVMADIYFYQDKNGVRHFSIKQETPEYKLFVKGKPKSSVSNPGDPRLSKKANNAIAALKDFNACLKKKEWRSQLYKKVLLETGKWLESEEARWGGLTAMEIKAALTDYENYESLMFRKNNGFGEGREGRIDHEGVLWLQFIETYPAASYDVDHNLEAMMIHVLESAAQHTDMAVMYMIDIANALKDRR